MTTALDSCLSAGLVDRWYGRSFGEPYARLFWHGDHLRVGILPVYSSLFRRLRPYIDRLAEYGMMSALNPVETHDGFAEVHELRRVPRITYCFEWSPVMWRAAVTHVLNLLSSLAAEGMTLRNPQPWYLVFDGPNPIYLHPGSIIPYDPAEFRRSWEKISRFFIRPLVLAQSGKAHLARQLLHDIHEGVRAEEVAENCDWFAWDWNAEDSPIALIERVREQVELLDLAERANRWLEYEHTDMQFTATSSWTRKREQLETTIQRFHVQSVIDLGANSGYYAQLAANCGAAVIGAELDEALVSRMWHKARSEKLTITPVVMDFTNPSPAYGVTNSWFPAATERLQSDLVLCFALAHHMVFGRYRLNFEEVARGVRSFSSRLALVEFCPAKRPVAEWRPDSVGWYSPNRFADALAREFGDAELLPPADDGRQLILCGPKGVIR